MVGILHLTDLHFYPTENFVLKRVKKLTAALRLQIIEIEFLYIVVTGDIVDKGDQDGFKDAQKFFDNLKENFLEQKHTLQVKFIFVPGNHDCNFKDENQLRKTIIKSIGYDNIGTNDDNSVIDVCTDIQKGFWEFYSRYLDIPTNKLFFQIYDKINDESICFNCINSSWVSQREEELNLFFPVKKIKNDLNEKFQKGSVNISVIHHPIYWFRPSGELNNRRELQEFIEENNSIIIYGHEHEEEHKKSKELWTNRETLYFSGKILQNKLTGESGFQYLEIDLKNKKCDLSYYDWNKKNQIYVNKLSKDFELNRELFSNKRFKHNIKFLNELDILKTPVRIENNTSVKLSDFYVYPDLEYVDISSKDLSSFYDSEKLISENKFSICVIQGENQSGKSSLMLMLYRRFVDLDKYPIFLDCNKFNSNSDVDLIIKKSFKEQYTRSESDYENFAQHDISNKIILLDNFQDITFNSKTTKVIIQDLRNRFGKIIITTNTLYGLISKIKVEFEDLAFLSLKPLGHRKRDQLIGNYHKLNTSLQTRTEEALLELTKRSFIQVETVLGDKLIPSYPIFILSILQTLYYIKPNDIQQTSYGYCYHSLIHIALLKNAKVENEFIDTYFNFLSEFALYLYKDEKYSFYLDELSFFFNEYQKKYHVGVSFEDLKNSLLYSKLIIVQDDEWKFSYEYIYFFLVARKLSELLGKDEGKNIIKHLCENIHKRKNANILVFIAHHTKDDFLIEEATFTAMSPFEDIIPITLKRNGDNYFNMIKDIVKEVSADIIEASSSPAKEREKFLQSKDEIDRISSKEDDELYEEEEDTNEILMPFFQAFRALEIVGQIIKNRKGSIPSNQLVDMIAELYNTAFRMISFLGQNLFDLKEELVQSISKKIEDDDSDHNIEIKVNRFFQFLTLQTCFGVFEKVVTSVGQKDLKDLFAIVAKKLDTPAADIVTFSIKSRYDNISKKDLQIIVSKYEKNHVVMQFIRLIVKSYLYQNHVDYRKRQAFASILKMKIEPQHIPKVSR